MVPYVFSNLHLRGFLIQCITSTDFDWEGGTGGQGVWVRGNESKNDCAMTVETTNTHTPSGLVERTGPCRPPGKTLPSPTEADDLGLVSNSVRLLTRG